MIHSNKLELPGHHLIWFQYKIIHKLLGVPQYLYYVKKLENAICNFCNDDDEGTVHLFILCKMTKQFWNNIKSWIKQSTDININVSPKYIVFGQYELNQCTFTKNLIFLTGKY